MGIHGNTTNPPGATGDFAGIPPQKLGIAIRRLPGILHGDLLREMSVRW